MKLGLYKFNGVALTQRHSFQRHSWVKLKQLPNPYSHDEALLLYQISNHEWLAWAPDHGEFVLCIWQIDYT
jgi:hypothetical protein